MNPQSYGLLKGKQGIIFGPLDEHSIGWQIALTAFREGAKLAISNVKVSDNERIAGWFQGDRFQVKLINLDNHTHYFRNVDFGPRLPNTPGSTEDSPQSEAAISR